MLGATVSEPTAAVEVLKVSRWPVGNNGSATLEPVASIVVLEPLPELERPEQDDNTRIGAGIIVFFLVSLGGITAAVGKGASFLGFTPFEAELDPLLAKDIISCT